MRREQYRDGAPGWLIRFSSVLSRLLPVVLVILIGYVAVTAFTNVTHPLLPVVQRIVMGYFVLELLVAFVLYENKWQFLRDKWFHILLVVPVFAVVRTVGRSMQLLRGGQAVLRSVSVASIARIGLLQQAFRSYRVVRLTAYLAEVGQAAERFPGSVSSGLRTAVGTLTGMLGLGGIVSTFSPDRGDHDDNERERPKNG